MLNLLGHQFNVISKLYMSLITSPSACVQCRLQNAQ